MNDTVQVEDNIIFYIDIIHRSVARCQCPYNRRIIRCMKEDIRLRFAERIRELRK